MNKEKKPSFFLFSLSIDFDRELRRKHIYNRWKKEWDAHL